MKKYMLFKKFSFSTVFFAVLFFISIVIFVFSKGNVKVGAFEYDDAKWKTNVDEPIEANEKGEVIVGKQGVYYSENLGERVKLDKNGILTITVEFSAKGIPLPTNATHCIWFIAPNSGSWIDMTGGDPFMPDGANSYTLGARMYFQNDEQVRTGRILFRCCDYKNYRTADRFYGFNKDDTGKHEISWTIADEGVTMYVDGNALRSDSNNGNQPTYWPERSAGTRWTLADFLDNDGNPCVYFGMLNGSFAETVIIHSIGNGEDLIVSGNYEGTKGSLISKEDGAYLTDGAAHTIRQYDLGKVVRGAFQIKEVPAYVYDGIDIVERNTVGKTAFSIDAKDALEDGYGFRISWKPLMSTGAERTEIEFGYLTRSGFNSYSSYVVPSIAVQKHTFAFFAGSGYAKIVADGISEYIPFGQNNDLWDLSENIDPGATYLQFSADGRYPDTYTGKWLVKLEDTVESDPTDWYVNDAEVAQITGKLQEGAVEYDYRMYPTVAANQTISVNGTAQDVIICGNVPVKLYSKIALNLETTLKVSEIPAYGEENAFILISFSNVVGGITNTETAANAFFARLSWKDASTLAVYGKMGAETKTSEMTVNADEIKLEFGWENSNSVIKINGRTVLTGSVTKGHFGSVNGVQGYFAVRTYNGSADENSAWAFTVSAPKHIEVSVASDTPVVNEESAEPFLEIVSGEKSGKKRGCGGAAGSHTTILPICFASLFALLLLKKKTVFIGK